MNDQELDILIARIEKAIGKLGDKVVFSSMAILGALWMIAIALRFLK